MSTPKNPLDKFATYSVKHVLVGFSHTEAACTANVGAFVGPVKSRFKAACGQAMVIINEFQDARYLVSRLEWTYDFYSPVSNTSTFMMGQLQITDQSGQFFPTTFREITQQLGVSESHIALLLRTFIIGKYKDGDDEITETIALKPFIFNMLDLTSVMVNTTPNLYTLTFAATYNTFGQLPTFSSLYQTTITHKDGALHKTIPTPAAPDCGIKPRGAEDGAKAAARKSRLDKSKPMKTLKDVFEAFREELQEQKFEHKRQLQEWMDKVRDDWTMKIRPPQQLKIPSPLPVDYIVEIDGAFKSCEVDNRNMPNEQAEQDQSLPGIRSITLPAGSSIITAVPHLFKYSKQVARFALNGQSFKTNLCVLRRCLGKYDVFMIVKQFNIPRNDSGGQDTGPGESAVKKPLSFDFQKGDNKDGDILDIRMGIGSDVSYNVLEQQIPKIQAEVVLGDREQTTYERIPFKDYFKALFSGMRTLAEPRDFGMQDGTLAAMLDSTLFDYVNSQTSCMYITIKGNPDLYQDLTRNPLAVAYNQEDKPSLYRYPEFYPMYAKVTIWPNDDATLGQKAPFDEPVQYYHTYHYHIAQVVSRIEGSNFIQQLRLLRTDDIT